LTERKKLVLLCVKISGKKEESCYEKDLPAKQQKKKKNSRL